MFSSLKPHIADLRKRLIISTAAVVVLFFISFSFYDVILNWMTNPVKALLPDGIDLVALQIQETFFTAMKVSFFAGLIFALPVIFWQIWLFVAPALYEHEKRLALPFTLFATVMFLLGCAFAYYVVIPYGFEFLIAFSTKVVTVMPSIGQYVSFFTKLLFGFGLAFQLPVLTFFLAKIGLVTDETLKRFFKYAIILIFVLSALLTPPDVITQLLMAAPLILLYGVSIYIARLINPAKDLEEDD